MDQSGNRLLTVQEVAKKLRISNRTVYNRIAPSSKNPFPVTAKRFGKLIRFDERELEKYINSMS